jgi:hypothetical protein
MANALTIWTEPTGTVVPKDESRPKEIVSVAQALTTRDQRQIVSAFEAESYEMLAGFVLNKALAQLKRQLATLGMEFVGEMLGRQDLDEDSIATVSISNFEAIKLARELGFITKTDAKRLGQQVELLAHFDNLEVEDAELEEMTKEEAVSFLRTCVNSVLGRADNVAPQEFVQFRSALESKTYKSTDNEIATLAAAPYFFKRTTLSVLLSNIKTKVGVKFEHTLGNIVVIVPLMWKDLKDQEKWSVGQSYAEAVNSGQSAAINALKKTLMAVQGFDYVPESLRSQTFSAAASAVINAHTGMNNFYNERPAVQALAKLGSTIPWPAFPVCMSAILAVYLGNAYGVANDAQFENLTLLKRVSDNQWRYYFSECLPRDDLILQKLAWHERPIRRWITLVGEFGLAEIGSKSRRVVNLLKAAQDGDDGKIKELASKLKSESQK